LEDKAVRHFLYPFLALCAFSADLSTTKPLGLGFEARPGAFVSRGPAYWMSVTPTGARLNLPGHSVRMRLEGSDPRATLEPLDRMPGRTNYFLGHDLRRSYELYGCVRSRGVYRGIDMLFRANQEHLEYDFEIAAGRDPGVIKVNFEGAGELRVDASGDLVLRTGSAEIHQPRPIAYQVLAGRKMPVSVGYQLASANQVGFRLGPYDRSEALVIDPQLVFDQFFGGTGVSNANAIALDAAGNIYVAGQTNSGNFPVRNAAQSQPGAAPLLSSTNGGQTFTPVPLGTAGNVIWMAASPTTPTVLYAATSSTVIKSVDGGATWTIPANAGLKYPPVAVTVDASSASTVYAATGGQGVFTSTNGGASWTQSTTGLMIPNSTPPSAAELLGVFASPAKAGTVFAVAEAPDFAYRSTDFGRTWTQLSFPAGNGPDSLVFSPSNPNTLFLGQSGGPLLQSTDGGDTWTSLADQAVAVPQGLAIIPANSIILSANDTGLGRSTDGGKTFTTVLPLVYGRVAVDPRNPAVVYALDSSGLYRSSDAGLTFTKVPLPGNGYAVSLFVSPADSRVFVAASFQQDAFVTKWSPDGSQILYSTYLGGSGNDSATGIAVDSTGSAYVAGLTSSLNFPVTNNAFQTMLAGPGAVNAQNAFITKLSPDGSELDYSTYLGGPNNPTGGFSGMTTQIAVDSAGEAVVAGSTYSLSFPVTPGAYQSAPVASCSLEDPFVLNSGTAFVSKLAADGSSLIFSTLLGGSCATWAQALALDSSGNAWVAGFTESTDFPVTKDAWQSTFGGDIYDGFLARFTSTGGLAYASYIGGPGYDTVTGVTLDQKSNVYLTGTSGGLSHAATPGAVQAEVGGTCSIFSIGPSVYQAVGSGFVLKLDPAAHNTLGLTYLGSPLCLFPAGIAVDGSGDPWIAGTLTPNGSAPQTVSPFQIGIGSGFVSKFSADFTQLLFSTYFDAVTGIALDSAGLAYVTGPDQFHQVLSDPGEAYIAKIDPTPSAIELDAVQSVTNPASPSNTQGIAPGEVLRILGKNIGPATATAGVINGGVLATSVAGVEVSFDGIPRALLSVSAQEIDLVAPFELAGKTATTVQVKYNGAASNAVKVLVANTVSASLGILSGLPMQVLGVFNSDFTANSASNPATAGSVVSIYVAGIGQSVPSSQDGEINHAPLADLPGPAQIQLFGEIVNATPLAVTFAGAAPGVSAGIFQINFVAPRQIQPGVMVSVSVGNSAVTFNLAVK
jgi:uncharacterized protein (TIGR03437 family)